jgi:hypothetical protein
MLNKTQIHAYHTEGTHLGAFYWVYLPELCQKRPNQVINCFPVRP